MATTTNFDAYCYLMRYPDVRKNWKGTALDHWNQYGQNEKRIPGCDVPDGPYTVSYSNVFDADCYLSRYEDVRLNGINPQEHWTKYGQNESRIPGCTIYTKVVDPASAAAQGVANAGNDAILNSTVVPPAAGTTATPAQATSTATAGTGTTPPTPAKQLIKGVPNWGVYAIGAGIVILGGVIIYKMNK